MNKFKHFVVFALLFSSVTAVAQKVSVDKKYKQATVEQLGTLIVDRYVFPDIAKKTSEHLNSMLKKGKFDEYTDTESFATALTEAVQAINKDKHMRIRPLPQRQQAAKKEGGLANLFSYRLENTRPNLQGFREAKKLEGNIGYLDLRGFARADQARPIADNYMKLLSTSDAIIIDLRKNGGGDPETVQYLCSYFFGKKTHLNSLYWREGDVTTDFWTQEVKGRVMPDVPLFILTSNYTFSAAEEFSYNMQTQKRATLVGETTGGGANPGGSIPINDQLMVFIPTGKAINPITGTNWEGVGVIPEVPTKADEVYDKAIELATTAAKKNREAKVAKQKKMLTYLETELAALKEPSDADFDKIHQTIAKCTKYDLLNEGEINQLGYHYLQKEKGQQAEAVFRSNTLLFPNSANVFDSYGEALGINGNKHASIKNYKMAVELAAKNKDPQLGLFEENLKKAMGKGGE